MKKKSSTEVWVTIGLAVFFLIFLSPIIIALFGSFREMGRRRRWIIRYTTCSTMSRTLR